MSKLVSLTKQAVNSNTINIKKNFNTFCAMLLKKFLTESYSIHKIFTSDETALYLKTYPAYILALIHKRPDEIKKNMKVVFTILRHL